MVIYDQIKKDIGQILRKLCEQKDIEIIEAEACPDHIHMLISFSPKYSISYVMGVLSRVMRKFVCRLWLRMKSAGNRDVFQDCL